ncbi:MAG: GNAT family N-acetyltransferase [Marinoscillum sp.]
MSLELKTFRKEHFDALHKAFINAFSDYYLKFSPTREQFARRVFQKLNISLELSALAWQADMVSSFVLHTINTYQGIKTIYNGGTGTILTARRTGGATKLYEFLMPVLRESGAERILLEVIDKNSQGQNLYESLGFRFNRVLRCFTLKQQLSNTKPDQITIETKNQWNPSYTDFMSFEPSFMDSSHQLQYNLANEVILEAKYDGSLAGYLVFQNPGGRVSQIAVKSNFRNKGVGQSLLAACQNLCESKQISLMNIPEGEIATIDALEAMGFVNELNQFELELII